MKDNEEAKKKERYMLGLHFCPRWELGTTTSRKGILFKYAVGWTEISVITTAIAPKNLTQHSSKMIPILNQIKFLWTFITVTKLFPFFSGGVEIKYILCHVAHVDKAGLSVYRVSLQTEALSSQSSPS